MVSPRATGAIKVITQLTHTHFMKIPTTQNGQAPTRARASLHSTPAGRFVVTETRAGSGAGVIHSFNTVYPSASSVGPRNTPMNPNASAPPITPKKVKMNGISDPMLISHGFTKL